MGTLAEQMKQEQRQQTTRPTRLNLLYAQAYNNLPTQLQTFLPRVDYKPYNPQEVFGDGFANKESNYTAASNANL